MTSRRLMMLAAGLSVLALPLSASADRKNDGDVVTAEFFEAMEAGQIDVKFIPKDATNANVLVRNLTDQPLNVELPKAFAGVPILKQGMMGGGMGGMGGGGGMGGMGGGMGGGGMGGGMMRVPPERMRKVTVTTVCLEHGKPDPNPKMAYKIVPLSDFTDSQQVHVLCEALGYGQLTQNTAQAAAWHILDGLSWQELAAKNRVESKYLGTIKWFSPIELHTAMAVVRQTNRIADERGPVEPKADRPKYKSGYEQSKGRSDG